MPSCSIGVAVGCDDATAGKPGVASKARAAEDCAHHGNESAPAARIRSAAMSDAMSETPNDTMPTEPRSPTSILAAPGAGAAVVTMTPVQRHRPFMVTVLA